MEKTVPSPAVKLSRKVAN